MTTPQDFPTGSRVKFIPRQTSQPGARQLSSLGISGLYVDLSQPMTGTVASALPDYYTDMVHFLPDGWPLPEGLQPQGFLAHVSQVGTWEGVAVRCQIVDAVGGKVTKSDVERLVSEKLEREKGKKDAPA